MIIPNFPTYHVCREAVKDVKVALSGDGGDEVFCGYHYYGQLLRIYGINKALMSSLKNLAKLAALFWPDVVKGKDYVKRVSKGESYYLTTISWLSFIDKATMLSALKEEWAEVIGEYDPAEWFREELSALKYKADDIVGLSRALDFRMSLPARMLAKVDRVSMANSLEIRSPLLDHKLIEFTSRIPTHFLIDDNGNGKAVLKKLVAQWVPNECIYRRKHGFGMPLDQWFMEALQEEYVKPFLEGEKQTTFVKLDYLSALLKYQQRLSAANRLFRNRINILQSLVFLENWADRWL